MPCLATTIASPLAAKWLGCKVLYIGRGGNRFGVGIVALLTKVCIGGIVGVASSAIVL